MKIGIKLLPRASVVDLIVVISDDLNCFGNTKKKKKISSKCGKKLSIKIKIRWFIPRWLTAYIDDSFDKFVDKKEKRIAHHRWIKLHIYWYRKSSANPSLADRRKFLTGKNLQVFLYPWETRICFLIYVNQENISLRM